MTSTININIPAADADLLSAPIRANFVAAYNDINSIQAVLSGLGNLSTQSQSNVTITGGSIAGTALNAGTVPRTALASGTVNTLAGYDASGNFSIVTAGSYVSISSGVISFSGPGTGTVSSVEVTGSDGIGVSGSPITTTGTITLTLGDITPDSISAVGAISGSNLSGTNTGNVTLGTASGLTLVGQALSLTVADSTHTGALSSTDWSTFNNKQAAGTYVTSVTGTSNRITSTGGTTPVIDISASYVGQSSITTVGTLVSGATGTGFTVALASSTITGSLSITNGGFGRNTIGAANQIPQVNASATGFDYLYAMNQGVQTVDSPQFARLGLGQAADASAVMAATGQYFSTEFDKGSVTTTATINWDSGNVQYVTLTGNTTFTFSNPKSGGRYILQVAGAFSPTFPATVRWSGGSTPTPTASAGHKDIYTFIYSGKESLYDGAANLNFATT